MRAILAASAVLVVAACRGPVPQRVQAAPGPPAAQAPNPAPAGESFVLDPGAGRVWIYLRPDGALAKAGHSHVVTSAALRGSVHLAPVLDASSCAFELPVDGFVVDDPAERAAAGGEFAPPLGDEARAGTREHMLGDGQLDAARYPLLRLACSAVAGDAQQLRLTLAAQVAGHESRIELPVAWHRDGCRIDASGEAAISQAALGLVPYSALLGALRVADSMQVRYELHLRCAPRA